LNPEKPPKDIDISTDASFEEVQKHLPKTIGIGKAFGVGLVTLGDYAFEVSTFRKEGEYTDRRHPSQVSQGTIEEDSSRRDFTVNALYFDPINELIVDFHEGLADLKKRQIRCVGDASMRLHEDPLRILRLHRFAANLGLSVEEKTQSAADALAGELVHISLERVLLEISKVQPAAFASFAQNTRTAQLILLQQNSHEKTAASPTLLDAVTPQCTIVLPPEAFRHPGSLFMLMCLENFGHKTFDWIKLLQKWPLSLSERAHVELAVRQINLKFNVPNSADTELSRSQWYDFLEQCRWLIRQSRTELLDASWLIENLTNHSLDPANLLHNFCRTCSAEFSHLSLSQAIENTVAESCKPIRSELALWAQNKPQEALGWARLMTDISALLKHIGYNQKHLPTFMRHEHQQLNTELCAQACAWAEQNRGKKKTPRSST
jgi:tRNA nucleotidyltransferase/poly(A) polymerase